MSPYWAIFSGRLRMLLQYRTAALAGLGTQVFWGLIRVMAFEAFYRSSDAPVPLSVDQTADYIWLSQAFLMLLPIRLDSEIRAMVRSGSVAYELVRPLHLYSLWYARTVASCLLPHCAPVYSPAAYSILSLRHGIARYARSRARLRPNHGLRPTSGCRSFQRP